MNSPKAIKVLIWIYLILLLTEGALRKWVLPAYADALLVIRDPIVLLIYLLAVFRRALPFNGFVAVILVLAVASAGASLLAGQHNLVVMLYGLRINYLHLPLIWVMATVLDRQDVQRLGSFLLLAALPMTAVMVEQFRSPMNAFINRGVGDAELGQIFGADGRIRPPGLFAFITGPQLFLPLAAAFFFHQAGVHRRLPWPLLLAAGAAIAIALPVSISRTAALATGIVAATYLLSLPLTGRRGTGIFRIVVMLGLVAFGLSFLPIFQEGRDVFLLRWQTAATTTGGDAWGGVRDRLWGGVLQPFEVMRRVPAFGAGIGVGSNVGARLISGNVGFLLAEDEWSKVFMELGPYLGGAFILLRVTLTAYLGLAALRALMQEGEPLPLLLFAAVGVAVFQYQWGPPTVLGFAVFGSGLVLAALNPVPVVEEEDVGPVAPEDVPPRPDAAPSPYRPPVQPRLPAT